MKTDWDYTSLADAYLERPAYAPEALEAIFRIAGLRPGDRVCDVGAGVGHLTLPLAERGFLVDAVEPNDAMRANGQKRTAAMPAVAWSEGTGENTGRPSGVYALVSFGSSFNVCDRAKALAESGRLLRPGGHFACMWNHRDLDDPVQARIEAIIRESVPGYGYGVRREDQTDVIARSGLFTDIRQVEGRIVHEQRVEKAAEAWRSHATLHRQAGPDFPHVVEAIEACLKALGTPSVRIPYTTRAWVARRRDRA